MVKFWNKVCVFGTAKRLKSYIFYEMNTVVVLISADNKKRGNVLGFNQVVLFILIERYVNIENKTQCNIFEIIFFPNKDSRKLLFK